MRIAAYIRIVPANPSSIKTEFLLDDNDLIYKINPSDEAALEKALKLKDDTGSKLTVIGSGGKEYLFWMKYALSLGADEAILIENTNSHDILKNAEIVSSYLKLHNFDCVITGNFSEDQYTYSNAPLISEYLGIPFILDVSDIYYAFEYLILTTNPKANLEKKYRCNGKVVIGVLDNSSYLRYPVLKKKLSSEKTDIKIVKADNLSSSFIHDNTEYYKTEYIKPEKINRAEMLSGEMNDIADKLIEILKIKEII